MMRRRNLKRDSQRPSVVPPVHSSVEAEGEDGIGVWFTLASFAVGFALCYAGCQLEIPISFHPGLGFIGLGIIQLGLETIRTREDRYRLGDESTRDETFRDLPAVMSGFFWTCLGFGLLAYAILAAVGLQDVASAFLKARPGVDDDRRHAGQLQRPHGRRPDRRPRSLLAFLGGLPGRAFGVLLVLVGIGLVALGLLEIFFPSAYGHLIASLGMQLPVIE